MTPTTLNIYGLIANIIGTIILAFSLNAYLRSMRLVLDAHELYIMSVNSNRGPIVQITGTGVHLNRGGKKSNYLSWIGVILVIVGFACQLASYFVKPI